MSWRDILKVQPSKEQIEELANEQDEEWERNPDLKQGQKRVYRKDSRIDPNNKEAIPFRQGE